jgi:hypothetical protein
MFPQFALLSSSASLGLGIILIAIAKGRRRLEELE